MNLLLDTNIIIDYLGRKPPFFEDAERIIAAGYFGDAQLWASTQSFKDAFYVLAHYVSPEAVRKAILKLLEVVHPVDATGGDLVDALRLNWSDLEDCLIAVSARKAKADYLLTRDMKGFDRAMTPVLSPSKWLELVKNEERVSYSAIDL